MKRRACDDQDFGLKEGIPFTMYWRGHRARQELLDMVANRMEDALQVRFCHASLQFILFANCALVDYNGFFHAVHSLDILKVLEGCLPTE
jgi:hypothetical protein